MNHAILVLQHALRQKKLAANNDHALPFIEIGRNDNIRNSGLVFHREEDKAFGGARTLARNHAPRRAYKFPVLAAPEFFCGKHTLLPQLVPPVMHGMSADG